MITHLRHSTDPYISGPRFRPRREGAEAELVERWLDKNPIEPPEGCHLTVFHEPRIQSGFPDVVLTVWHRETAEHWRDRRPALSQADFQLLQLLVEHGPIRSQQMESICGKQAHQRLEAMARYDLVKLRSDFWRARPVREILAVRSIAAIEAKISARQDVVLQAHANGWFASRTSILIPRLPRTSTLRSEAESRGVGIWTMESGSPRLQLAPKRRKLPRSYVSWLFSEWAWQAGLDAVRVH